MTAGAADGDVSAPLDRPGSVAPATPRGSAAVPSDQPKIPSRRKAAGIAMSLTWLAFLLHASAVLCRGLAVQRPPWGNMYEFACAGSCVVTAVFLIACLRKDLRFLGLFVTGPRPAHAGPGGHGALHPGRPARAGSEELLAGHPRQRRVHRLGAAGAGLLGHRALSGAGLPGEPTGQGHRGRRQLHGGPAERRPSWTRRRTACTRSPSRCGRSPSSPAPSGPRTRGATTGAGTPRRSGRSSSG